MKRGIDMNRVGIDKIGFYTPPIYLDMTDLAHARGDEPAKYTIGIGQDQMAVTPISQDIISMAVNAGLQIINDEDRSKIDLVIVGTESAFDASKSSAVYVHELLNIQPHARSFEIKHACYAATAGLQMAKDYVTLHPDRKALVIGTDVARYGLATGGEVTQGAGAMALLVSADPTVLILEKDSAYTTKDIMDFWRPVYSEYAMVDGKYSNEQYLSFFNTVWNLYKEKTNRSIADIKAFSFHLPYTKMGKKALQEVLPEADDAKQKALSAIFEESLAFNRLVGNIYTGSLYLNLLSLLENGKGLKAGDRIGLFSYGSGAVGEFFTGLLAEDFKKGLASDKYTELLAKRQQVTVAEYEAMFTQNLPEDGSALTIDAANDSSACRLVEVKDHKRSYIVK